MSNQILIICGPTAVGKTKLALSLAGTFDGEVISSDSRHVYIGMDIVTGKDLPPGFSKHMSQLVWHGQRLPYYSDGHTRIWMVDLVKPDEEFNVSMWREMADLIIADILSRGRLPIIAGGTGLYLKALTSDLENISVPPDPHLREKYKHSSASELYKILAETAPQKASLLNLSDRANPRRLIRHLEIALYHPLVNQSETSRHEKYSHLTIGLTGPVKYLNSAIETRIDLRLKAGALAEVRRLVSKYSYGLPSMSACGYAAFQNPNWHTVWLSREKQYLKKQLTWFKAQPGIRWFDITQLDWQTTVTDLVQSWYNNH